MVVVGSIYHRGKGNIDMIGTVAFRNPRFRTGRRRENGFLLPGAGRKIAPSIDTSVESFHKNVETYPQVGTGRGASNQKVS